jgi:predicted MFS family arabinose efflux permease
MLGFAIGGLLSAWLSPVGAIAIDGASYLLSAAMLSRLPALRPEEATDGEGLEPGMLAGIRMLRRDVWVRRSLLITLALALGGGSIEDMVAAFSDEVVGRGDAYAGLLALAVPMGTAVSAILQGSSVDPARLIRLSASLAVGAGLTMFPLFAFGDGIWAAFLAFFFVGVAFAAILPANVIAGLRIPDSARGSVMGFFQGLIMGTYALATMLGGWGVGTFGAIPFMSGAAIFIVMVGVASFRATAAPRLEKPAFATV